MQPLMHSGVSVGILSQFDNQISIKVGSNVVNGPLHTWATKVCISNLFDLLTSDFEFLSSVCPRTAMLSSASISAGHYNVSIQKARATTLVHRSNCMHLHYKAAKLALQPCCDESTGLGRAGSGPCFFLSFWTSLARLVSTKVHLDKPSGFGEPISGDTTCLLGCDKAIVPDF